MQGELLCQNAQTPTANARTVPAAKIVNVPKMNANVRLNAIHQKKKLNKGALCSFFKMV